MINNRFERYARVGLVLAVLLLSLFYSPGYDFFANDKEIFRYGGMLLLKGGVPYRDLFDHKPPLIFFIYAASRLLGPWGLWIIDFALSLLSTLAFYEVCRRRRLPFPWLLPLLFILLVRDYLLLWGMGIGLTREFTTFFILLFFCVLIGGRRYKYQLLGLLAGLTFFTQQEQVITLIPLLVYAFWTKDSLSITGRLILTAAGFSFVLIPILAFFAVHGALGSFWQDSFGFNIAWYATARKSFWAHFRTAKHVMDDANYEVPFMVAAVSGIVSLFLPNTRKGLILSALAALLASFGAEWLGARPEEVDLFYYFLAVSAPICIVLFSVMTETGDRLIPGRTGYAIYGAILSCSLAYTAVQHGTHLQRPAEQPETVSPELAWLQRNPPRDYQLYVMGNTAFIYAYNRLGILSPSPWIYQHFWKWYPAWDADQAILKGIGQDLLSHHCTYVVLDTVRGGWFINPASSRWWLSFMDRYYTPVPLQGTAHSLLWKIKDPVSTNPER